MTISATWHKAVDAEEILQRSSQVLSVVDGRAYVFGGELRPREPRDNDVHVLELDKEIKATLSTKPATSSPSPSPSPRVGSASTALNGKIYLFSGRGGVAMTPVEEHGSIWEFDPSSTTWTRIEPAAGTAYPPARSYHCMTNDGLNTLYVHAGCPEKGRLSDLWAFNLATREWRELAPAPDPPRGGPSIAFAEGKLYRMNGFDGKTEQGGSLDVYTPETNAWTSLQYPPDGRAGPAPRSVSALLAVHITTSADGKRKTGLVTLFGERDPSALGHQGAGKMLSDVWLFDLASQTWHEVDVQGESPAARGWFAADTVDENKILVQGGLGESNERIGDAWVLAF
ncbi:hypothetical protein VTN77DRAFT_3829 [Rasamsonia byssochlamydoides]|uniref:uncharacterized protein n=1 Tax=Rasamsonia byssochlamydoides TaxID=89139 RepID=UPI003742EA3E